MKYANLAELVAAVKSGEPIEVIVDNDCVNAYLVPPGVRSFGDDHEEVYGFQGNGPEGSLIEALTLLGLAAERA